LVAGSYTLFVRGDRIVDADDSRPLAQSGRLAVANRGTSNVSVVTMPGTGQFGASSNTPAPPFTASTASAVAFGNFSGAVDASNNPIPDLVLADPADDVLFVFQGQQGGGYSTDPTTILFLDIGANPTGLA